VIILALGIGANTTMFTILNTLFLRQPPLVVAPDDLVRFTLSFEDGWVGDFLSYPDYEYYRDENEVFSGVLAYRYSRTAVAVGDGDRFSQARAGFVSGNYFDVLGVTMAEGRSFLGEEDETPGSHPVAVLGYGFWARHFGSDPSAVGRTITLNGDTFTIVGVAPAGFRGVSPVEEPPDLFLPAMMRGFGLRRVPGQFSYSWNVLGRLHPGVSLPVAQSNIDVLEARYDDLFAAWIEASAPPNHHLLLTRQIQFSPDDANALGHILFLLSLVVGTVLLVACANVALLMLARASARGGEIAIRGALGAGRWRVTRQLFNESLILALAGCVGGLCIAFWGAGLAASLIPFQFDVSFIPDRSVILLALLVATGSAVLFGLTPAIQSSKTDIASVLRQARHHGRRSRLRDALVVIQLAISIFLVTGAGLFARSLMSAQNIELGFQAEKKLLVTLPLSSAGYGRETGRQFLRDVSDRISALPEVTGVSTTLMIPFRGRWSEDVLVPATQFATTELELGFNSVGPGHFSVWGIPLVAGREFTAADDENAPLVAIVNETTAARLWAGQSAIGKTIVWNDSEWTVVGVVRDARYYEIGEAPQTQLYLSAGQYVSLGQTLVVATIGDPWDVARSVEEAIRAYDPRVAIHRITAATDVVRAQYGQYRVLAILVGMFGVLALLLAAVGLYGVQAYLVAGRVREIGIRMALGAAKGRVAGTIVSRGTIMATVGIVLGLGLAFASARMIESMLFGIRARDPITFVTAPILLLGVAIAASLIPAIRATKVDPAVALREQ
jgi:predicted permease